jgi:threonine dehydrogenase-like Zn-dependent dehydrogenase
MIGRALGAQVIAVDIREDRLETARRCGAAHVINGESADPVEAIRQLTGGSGAHVSVDALGSRRTCWNSICCLPQTWTTRPGGADGWQRRQSQNTNGTGHRSRA